MHVIEFKLESRQESGLRLGAMYKAGVPYLVSDGLAQALSNFAGLGRKATYHPPNPWRLSATTQVWGRVDGNIIKGDLVEGVTVEGDCATATRCRRLIHYVGGLGDYVALLPSLLTLQKTSPQDQLDVVTEPIGHDLLRLGGFDGACVNYPLAVHEAEGYDALLFIEDPSEHPRYRDWDLTEVFADLAGLTISLESPRFSVGPEARDRMKLPSSPRRRVGLQLRGSSPLRTYPATALRRLLRLLVSAGIETHLFGDEGAEQAASAPPYFHNWCGKTPKVEDLLALVEQMDLLAAPDSFFVHLGGAMGIPTLGLFTVIPASLRVGRYPSVSPIEPRIGCNPCFGRAACPLGHGHCLVWDHAIMAPEALARRILDYVSSQSRPPESRVQIQIH